MAKVIPVRLDDVVWEEWVRAAELAGQKLSAWVREMVNAGLREKPAEGEIEVIWESAEIERLRKELEVMKTRAVPAAIPSLRGVAAPNRGGPFPENDTVNQAKEFFRENKPKEVALCPRCLRIGRPSCQECKKKAGLK